MAQTAQKINWLTAPAVPVQVLQMLASGQEPAGTIIDGPNGQRTYKGPIALRDVDESWRDNLKVIPDK